MYIQFWERFQKSDFKLQLNDKDVVVQKTWYEQILNFDSELSKSARHASKTDKISLCLT